MSHETVPEPDEVEQMYDTLTTLDTEELSEVAEEILAVGSNNISGIERDDLEADIVEYALENLVTIEAFNERVAEITAPSKKVSIGQPVGMFH